MSELHFNFQIESISKFILCYIMCIEILILSAIMCLLVCLPDSVLAFHKHGMQGRSFKNGEVTQEISDPSRTYRLLGSDKYVLLY